MPDFVLEITTRRSHKHLAIASISAAAIHARPINLIAATFDSHRLDSHHIVNGTLFDLLPCKSKTMLSSLWSLNASSITSLHKRSLLLSETWSLLSCIPKALASELLKRGNGNSKREKLCRLLRGFCALSTALVSRRASL